MVPADARAGLVIDAAGKFVAPGFIDAFAGGASTLLNNRGGSLHLPQGVTTVAVVSASAEERSQLEAQGTAVNVAWLSDAHALATAPGGAVAALDADLAAGSSGVWIDRASEPPLAPDTIAALGAAVQRRNAALIARLPAGLDAEAGVSEMQELATAVGLPVAWLLSDSVPARAGTWAKGVARSHSAAGTFVVRFAVDTTDIGSEDLRALLSAEQSLIATGGRNNAAFPMLLARQRRGESPFSLAQEMRRITSHPAFRLALRLRGVIREGYFADVVVFDPTAIDAGSPPRGVEYLIVNGVLTVARGSITGARPGTTLRGPAAPRPGA